MPDNDNQGKPAKRDKPLYENGGRRPFLKAAGTGALAMVAGCSGENDTQPQTEGSTSDGETSTTGGSTSRSIDGPIKVGALVPLPGNFAGGTGMAQATELKVKQINEDGGILGSNVELVIKDTQLDPAKARSAYRELILEEEVDATLGIFSSEVALAVSDESTQHNTLHIAGGGSINEINESIKQDYESYKHWFMGIWTAYDMGYNLGLHAQEQWDEMGFQKIGIAVENIAGFRDAIQPAAVENLPDNVEIAFESVFSSDTNDFSPILDRGEENDIDLLFSFLANGGAALTSQWAKRKPSFAIGGNDVFAGMPARWEQTSGQVEHEWTIVVGSGPGFEHNQATKDFIQAHRDEYGGPPPHNQAYTQYNAATTYFNSIRQTGTLDLDENIEYIENELDYESVIGRMKYRERDHQYPHSPRYGEDYSQMPIIQWQDVNGGKQVGLWPDNVRSGSYEPAPWI